MADDNKIITVAQVVLNFQLVFNKEIQLVHVNIGEQLAGQIAQRHAFAGISTMTSQHFS